VKWLGRGGWEKDRRDTWKGKTGRGAKKVKNSSHTSKKEGSAGASGIAFLEGEALKTIQKGQEEEKT